MRERVLRATIIFRGDGERAAYAYRVWPPFFLPQTGRFLDRSKVCRRWKKGAGTFVTAWTLVLLAASFSPALAQSLGGLGQLLGGGASRHQQQSSGQSNSSVIVERDAAPFVGRFVGKQKAPSFESDLNAHFACYPAHDAALSETKTFVCYTTESQPRVPE